MTEQNKVTLGEFIIEKKKDFQYSLSELDLIFNSIRLAAKVVSFKLTKGGLEDYFGDVGLVNIQGEEQQKLDVYANEIFIQTLIKREIVCGIASEENEDFIHVQGGNQNNENSYIVMIDPLDGSSNIDVNVSVGTIFSIYRRITPIGTPVTLQDFLQPGINQVAAGYVIYGTSTMIVYSTGNGVNGFTLNPTIGTFYLSHPNISFPTNSLFYSVNEGNFIHFPKSIKNYIQFCKMKEADRPYSSRYTGSLITDIHRNMIKGGIFLYPSSSKTPKGKLRLLYECNPLAFITEQAGGKASNGYSRIMEVLPTSLHERTPFFCGSLKMVEKLEEFILAED